MKKQNVKKMNFVFEKKFIPASFLFTAILFLPSCSAPPPLVATSAATQKSGATDTATNAIGAPTSLPPEQSATSLQDAIAQLPAKKQQLATLQAQNNALCLMLKNLRKSCPDFYRINVDNRDEITSCIGATTASTVPSTQVYIDGSSASYKIVADNDWNTQPIPNKAWTIVQFTSQSGSHGDAPRFVDLNTLSVLTADGGKLAVNNFSIKVVSGSTTQELFTRTDLVASNSTSQLDISPKTFIGLSSNQACQNNAQKIQDALTQAANSVTQTTGGSN